MKVKSLYLLTLISFFLSCKQEISELKIEKKKSSKEIKIKTKKTSVNEDNQIAKIGDIIGNWFIPHNADVNIEFNKNGRFVFNEYNAKTEKEELLVGSFKLENGVITLFYDDRAKQKFKISKGINGDTNYYITKGNNYYFVKGEND